MFSNWLYSVYVDPIHQRAGNSSFQIGERKNRGVFYMVKGALKND